MLLHPGIATRDCSMCQKYMTTDSPYGETGVFKKNRRGELVERPESSLPLCRLGNASKCPKGTPENQNVLSGRNQQFYRYYRECKGVGRFPDDGWFRYLASIVRSVEEEVERKEKADAQNLLLRTLLAAAGRG